MVSVIVVSFNTRELLRACLGSVETHHEVIVVDNASIDGSAEMVAQDFPNVTLVRNHENVGFGVANNQGIALAMGDLVLLLNSDAEAQPGSIDLLAKSISEGVVAAGGKLVHSDGRLQESAAGALTLWVVACEQLYLERMFRSYWKSSRLPKGGEVEQVMGACLMMRPVEMFDERFFLYCEDTELCKRLRHHGRIQYVPEAVFVHHLGSSSKSNPSTGVMRYNWGKELYFRLHHGTAAWLTCLLLDRLGALLRCIVKPRTFLPVLFAHIQPGNWNR